MLLQVYAMYAALLLTAFNRLPLRLPTRGPLAGRKHNKGGENSSTPVMFADVAGVDEAKEELQEIVVRRCSGWILCGFLWCRTAACHYALEFRGPLQRPLLLCMPCCCATACATPTCIC
jgi:hypothetical protein